MPFAARMFGPMVEADAAAYVRARDLKKLIAVFPSEIENHSRAGTEHIIGRITKCLAAERRRAIDGHWSYDLNRHIALLAAHKAELKQLAHLQNSEGLARFFQAAAE